MNKKAVLIIMDGFGLAAPSQGNAVYMAKKPNLDRLLASWPHTTLQASGLDVGLPEGQMGNSEVGHTNMGAGRVVFQILPKMTQEIKNGKFFENKVYIKAMEDAKANGKALHIMGLLSDGGVHSHLFHIFGILDMAKARGVEKVYVHCFLDGRDVLPTSGAGFARQLRDKCEALGNAQIASVQGRFWGMDRDKRWDRVEKGYNAAGDRNFCLLLNPEDADELAAEGWNVRYLNPKDPGDEPVPYIQIKVGFGGKGRPPKVVMITRKGKTQLDEESISICGYQIFESDIKDIKLLTNVIDDYIASQDENIRKLLDSVRAMIADTILDAEEKISWGMPTCDVYIVH